MLDKNKCTHFRCPPEWWQSGQLCGYKNCMYCNPNFMDLISPRWWKVSFEKYFPLVYQTPSAFHSRYWVLTKIVAMLMCFSFTTSELTAVVTLKSFAGVFWLVGSCFFKLIFTSVLNNVIYLGYFSFSDCREHSLCRNNRHSLKQSWLTAWICNPQKISTL